MNQLTKLSIWRPLLVLMVILGIVVLGIRAYLLLPVERVPKVDLPVASVIVVYPGASPKDVEELVIEPIEDATSGISGIDEVRSIARESVGVMILRFVEGTNGDQAAIDVDRQVAAIRSELPDSAEEPIIIKADVGAIPIMELTLNGPQSESELFELADKVIKPRLLAIPGVARVNISGGREQTALVELDPARMAAYGVSVPQISAALVQENLTIPAGSLTEGRQRTSVRSVGKLTGVEEMANLVVAGKPSPFDLELPAALTGEPSGPEVNGLVHLRDVATVRDDLKEQTQILRLNGQEAVGLSVIKTGGANAVRVADNIRQTVKDIERTFPEEVQLKVVVDDSEFTRASIESVLSDLFLAVLITGAVMLLFLHLWRSTIIVLLAIPTSLIATFLVMWVLGFSLDTLTLMALALSIGILVDDSVVVLENIVRHLNQGESPFQAAYNGRAEIGLAAVAITLADVVVYVPVAFTSGLAGQFFRSYGLTIAAAVLFSLFVSFTLTPMLASRWLRRGQESTGLGGRFVRAWERGFDRLSDWYARLLGWSLSSHFHRLIVLAIAALSLAGALAMIPIIGIELAPQEDDNRLLVTVELPPGTDLDATDAVVRQVEQIIVQEVPEATRLLSRIGGSNNSIESFFLSGSGGPSSGTITIILRDKNHRQRSASQIIDDLRPKLTMIPDARIQLSVVSSFNQGGSAALSNLEVRIVGEDLDMLNELAGQVETVMHDVPGVVDVLNVDGERAPEVRAVLDRQRVSDLGLSAAQVGLSLRTAVAGSEIGTIDLPDGSEVDITVRAGEVDRENMSRLSRLPLGFLNDQPLTLDQVAHLERGEAPAQIQRLDRQHFLTIRANAAGRSAGRVAAGILQAVEARVDFPPGYRVQMSGITEIQQDAFRDMYAALALSVVLLYMLLVALYESFTHPLAIMFSLPVALVGAFGVLLLTGNTLNIMSLLGMILLMGVVTKNAILLVDFTNILRREQGMPRREALIEAGRMRLRPILMTTFSIVFAMIPLALQLGAGAELRAPLAVVVIGGTLSSLLLTLILIPTVYSYLDGLGGFLNRTIGRRLIPTAAEGTTPAAPQPAAPAVAQTASSGSTPLPIDPAGVSPTPSQ